LEKRDGYSTEYKEACAGRTENGPTHRERPHPIHYCAWSWGPFSRAPGFLFSHGDELHSGGRRIFLSLDGFDSRQAGVGLWDHEPLRRPADARVILGQPPNQDGDDEPSHHRGPV